MPRPKPSCSSRAMRAFRVVVWGVSLSMNLWYPNRASTGQLGNWGQVQIAQFASVSN